MKGKQPESSRRDDGNGRRERVVAEHSEGKPEPGDVIWTKLSGRLWWPALVVEEDNARTGNKRRRRSDSDVLVRLYGSSKQLYVDPVKCRSQFETILGQNNGSCHEILWKSVLKELPHLEPDSLEGCRGKADSTKRKKSTRDKADKKTTTSIDEVTASTKQKNTPQKKKVKADDRSDEDRRAVQQDKGGELTPRRVKVMQTLGLVPPSGSPF